MSTLPTWLETTIGTGAGVSLLAILSRLPGGRWIAQKLLLEPAVKWVHDTQRPVTEKLVTDTVAGALDEKLAPILSEVEAINNAINHVAPGEPPIKDRVRTVETEVAVANAKLDVLLARK